MKKKLFFKIFVFAVIAAFLTVTSCKDYDDDINKLTSDLAALKADLEKKIQDQKTTYDKTIGDLQTDLGKVKEDLKKAITQEGLDEALALYVKLEAFNKYKGDTDKSLKDLKEAVDKAATKEELANLQTLLEGKISEAKTELGLRIGALETLLDLKDGKLGVIEDIKKELAQHLEKINKNAGDIKALQEFLESDYESLKEMDETLRGLIDKKVDIETFNQEVERIDNKIDTVKKELEKKIEAVDKKLDIERLRINTLFNFTRQLKGLTFIPTRGLPAEKTMKLYYFAGDYTAEHVLIYRVSPSNSMYGRDFTIESLNYQVTTRSADDGVNDGSERVDVRINPDGKYYVPNKQEMQQGIKQFGDILYVPVHIQSENPCEVYGNIDWWGNEFFTLDNTSFNWGGEDVLSPDNFPNHVVKTVKNAQVFYEDGSGNKGLSLVITAKAKNLDEKEGEPAEIRVKSTEHVNTYLIPTQIKLAESKGKGNEIVNENLTTRLLKFTLTEATTWANANENDFPNDNKNWNVLAWSGNQGEGGVWTPGKIDLNKYVSSFFYPQDGGDLSRGNTVPGDPHRYLWAEFGKEFGEPYFDKPHYAKPVYEFEQMTYNDTNHNIIIGPEGGEGVGNHYYATIEDGHFLTVINDPAKIQGIRNKKLIIKVTQVNSECDERQPVGYLVIKYTDSPEGIWPDVDYTIDLTPFPYYHKACGQQINGSKVISQTYTDGDAGTTFTHKNGLLELFYTDRFMSPINAPESYGLAGTNNPGDVHFILAGNLQLNGIGEHNMGNIYNIQRRDASVVAGSVKFKAAANNHVNDADNVAATGVTAEDAFRHVMIRYEYDNHSYIVYVDDHAPAGDYEITYLLENKENNTQHGNRLFLTFKFKVALRDITVEHDKNTVNWQDDNKTIRVQHTRIHNTIVPDDDKDYSLFRSDEGYRVDLKQAFILEDGTVDMTTQTLPAVGGVNAGNAPHYRPKFEFIQDAAIKAAGFSYVRDADNYLTRIELNGQLAARIDNDPADRFNYLYITYSKEGDLLYNYLMQDMLPNNDLTKHNVWTKWGKTELTLKDDMERLLPVRLVTDINGDCGWLLDVQIENPVPGLDFDRFPNGNYYYIDDFNIKFERALRWAFTTVELTDDQQLQAFVFDFETKTADPEVYRGLFDHAYYGANPPAPHVDHGYGNLVHPRWNNLQLLTPWTFTNPFAQAVFYGVETRTGWISSDKFPPMMFTDPNPHHLTIANPLGIGGVTINGDYTGLDYRKVEISTDGGNTWKPADQDYFTLAHQRRYFNVITVTGPISGKVYRAAIWQGDQTAITSPIYFRVPVVNQSAINNGMAPDANGNYWMTFRHGYAKVKGYAVFKINPRQ